MVKITDIRKQECFVRCSFDRLLVFAHTYQEHVHLVCRALKIILRLNVLKVRMFESLREGFHLSLFILGQ